MRSSHADGEDVTVTTEIEADRTVVTVDGEQDVAVVIESASGERVYLPAETTESDAASGPYDGLSADSPYEGVGETPYEGVPADSPYEGLSADSPYGGIGDEGPYDGLSGDSPYDGLDDGPATETFGVVPTADGVRIVHPEPATDVRLLR